jgi:hypothetical protein
MSERPLRYCDVCGGLDDHPRHVQVLRRDMPDFRPTTEFLDGLESGPVSALAQLVDGRTRVAHLDCCAAQGCPLCSETEQETAGRRGQDLIDHLAAQRAAAEG